MSTPGPAPQFRLAGWHVLVMVVGFFAVVVGVDVGFAISAYRTFPGEVSVTPYEDGVAYNKKLAQMASQQRLGWRVAAAVASGGEVEVVVRDRTSAPVQGLALTGRLERPATEAGRVTVRFRETMPGVSVATPAGLAGTWDLTVELGDRKGDAFEAERRLTWP